ncbi:MAG: RNA polymerase sigma factor [Cytophagaceae bacterium]|nr:RNA polymerase sigma factor [Cytophagaceae bacterium]
MKEEEIIHSILKGEKELYELIMRKYNQRLYRIARAMVKDEAEVEDILQDTYLKAFENLKQFEGRSQFSTWVTRILINNSNASLNKRKRVDGSIEIESRLEHQSDNLYETPDQHMSAIELKKILEEAIDKLPENLRNVYVMREVEGLHVSETAECLSISEENVKTRLHRAKSLLKEELYRRSKGDIEVFRFGLERCDRIVLSVMCQLGKLN